MPTKSKTTEKAPSADKQRAAQPDDKRPREFEQDLHPALALQRAKVLPASALKANDILALQRTIGNRAVQHILAAQSHEPQASASGTPSIQRQMDEDEPVQRKPVASPMAAPNQHSASIAQAAVEPKIEAAIKRAHGGGQPLPENTQARMEHAFGANFSEVRVHTDAAADHLNRSLQSRAFTTGQDLFFKRGEYNPGSPTGRELIAHELTHVMQQVKPRTQKNIVQRRVIDRGDDQGPILAGDPTWRKSMTVPPAPAMIRNAYIPYTREEIINTVKAVESEKQWATQEARKLQDNPLAAKRLDKEWKDYKKALDFWKDDGTAHSKGSVDATKKLFVDEKTKWEPVLQIEPRLEVLHKGKTAELEPYQKLLESLPWRETYATQDQKNRIKALRDVMKPHVDEYKGKLDNVEKSRKELAEVKLADSAEKVTTARENIELAEENTPARNRPLKQGAQRLRKLIKKLDKDITTQLEKMVNDARTDHKLDVETGEVKTIVKKMTDAKVRKEDVDENQDTAKKRIKDAVTLQHKPTRARWYREMGMPDEDPAMVKDGEIAGDEVHATLYKQPAFPNSDTRKDITAVSAASLQNDLLGRGHPWGYHLTIDQKRGSPKHPHAYRGERRVRMKQYLVREGTTKQEAATELGDKRDAKVAANEKTIQDIHTNKGKGVNKTGVQRELTHE